MPKLPVMKPFDKEEVLDEEILPLVRQIVDLCNKHDIPYFIDFVYACSDPKGETVDHCTSMKNDNEERTRFVGPYNLMLSLLRGETDHIEHDIRGELDKVLETWGKL